MALPNYISAILGVIASQVVFRLGRDVSRERRMGSYELVEKLGGGGMGEVWLARHRMLARPAAIKLVRLEAIGARDHHTEEILKRFEWEAEATAALRSPHTIALYDFGRTDTGLLYYAMEHLEGLDLRGWSSASGPCLRSASSSCWIRRSSPWPRPTARACFTETSSRATCS
jgi:eukaryotic-like serine/threonine-protein kinase